MTDQTSDRIDELAEYLLAQLYELPHSSPEQAFIRRYLGTPRHVLGVPNNELRRLAKESRRTHWDWPHQHWLTLLDRLYGGDLYEERALAGIFLGELRDVRVALDLARLRVWLADQTGWAEVDNTCQSIWSSAEVLARWEEWQPFLESLAQADSISLRRASLVLLVTPLHTSLDQRLSTQAFANIERMRGERNPLITKAVSWVLRAMSQQQPDLVRVYLDTHDEELPAIAVRETRKKLETGKKSGKESRKE